MRSRAYPSVPLGLAVHKIELFNKNLGSVGYQPRDKVAVGIGYKGLSGASSRAIAALVHYGLLERQRDTYALSLTAKEILFPQQEGDRDRAVKNALMAPALFKELIQQYEGGELPGLLGNILTSAQYGINPKVKEDAAEIFRSSLNYAGVLDGSRVLPLDAHEDITASDVHVDPALQAGLGARATPVHEVRSGEDVQNRIEIILREGVKAAIYAPYNLTDTDKQKLKTIIDLL